MRIMAEESGKTNEIPKHDAGTTLGRTILVVDDERVIADTLVAILRTSGFAAMAAYDGESALQAVSSGVPDLLISDVCMPGMNGVELAIEIRNRFPRCKVLLFSGHAAARHLLDEAQERGYDFQLLSKPIHPRDLLEHLRRLAQPAPDVLRESV
jgi:DNA-binding NtrC family response regulator